jgi:putative toxin-antitoxin system antitoxin component (TIGR02293 family)
MPATLQRKPGYAKASSAGKILSTKAPTKSIGPKALSAPVNFRSKPGELRSDIRALSHANPFVLIEAIRSGVPATLVQDMATMMGRPRADLLKMFRVPVSTFERKRVQGLPLQSAESERVLGFLMIVNQVEALVAGSGNAKGFDAFHWVGDWIEQPCPALGNRAPKDLLDTTEGLSLVSKVIAQSASGAYA